jgi:hypothetical protein
MFILMHPKYPQQLSCQYFNILGVDTATFQCHKCDIKKWIYIYVYVIKYPKCNCEIKKMKVWESIKGSLNASCKCKRYKPQWTKKTWWCWGDYWVGHLFFQMHDFKMYWLCWGDYWVGHLFFQMHDFNM